MGKRCIGQHQRGKTIRQQRTEIHFIAKSLSAQGRVALGKTRLGKPHTLRQRTEYLCVGPGFAHLRDGGPVQKHIGVAIGQMYIPMLQLGGGRQDVVGVIGRVGLEMLQHHGEQVVAGNPATTWADSGATATGLLL